MPGFTRSPPTGFRIAGVAQVIKPAGGAAWRSSPLLKFQEAGKVHLK